MFKKVVLIAIVALGVTALNGAVLPVTDANVLNALTLNDWVTSSASINSTVGGASFTLGFQGTRQVSLQVDNSQLAGVTASRYPIIAWTVNGGLLQNHQLAAGETSVLLASGVTNPIIDFYIEGMSPFEDRYTGNVPPNSVRFTGFAVDDGGTTVPVVLPRKVWLNIGDSIMSGDGALYSAGQGRPGNDYWAASDNARASYGYLLAQHYGYREVRLAYGGYNWGGGLANVPALATLIDQKTSTISRLSGGLLNPVPDVVLINLGENGAPALTDVTNALFRLRSRVTPATKVIVMIPVAGTARPQVAQGFNTYKNSSLDTNAFLVDLGTIAFATADGQHPTAAGHQAIYNAALPYVDGIIIGSPALAQDTEPATASAFVGEPVTFSARFTSDQPLTCQWWCIRNGVTNLLAGATNASLTLTNLQLTQAGAYFLTASNSLGGARSQVGALTVSSLPAPSGNLITAIAAQTGRGMGTFVPGWTVLTNRSLLAGLAPSSASGDFSLEVPGRSVNSLTAGMNGALTRIPGTVGYTTSTNYVTCGNGNNAGATLVYTLPGSTCGYDLTNITVYGGWADNGRDQQAYTVYYATVLAPSTFVPLAMVNYNPTLGSDIQSATRVSLLPANGPLATNVAALKFDFTAPASENGYCGYHQITVFGSAAAAVGLSNTSPVVQTVQYAASAGAFDSAIKPNLIRKGQASLGTVTASHGPSIFSLFTTAGLNDGSAAANANLTYYGNSDASGGNLPVTLTFTLNTNAVTGGSPAGYDVKSVQTITGWNDSNLANETFQLLLSLNGGAYQNYGTFNVATNTTSLNNGNNSILHTLTNTTSGVLAKGVTGIQLVFATPGGIQGGSGGTLIRELQVFGTPTIPTNTVITLQTAAGGNLQLSWPQGTLLEATNLGGPWVSNPAASPFTVRPTEPERFYRVQLQ